MCLLVAGCLPAAENKDAARLYKQGQRAELSGKVVEAYLLYSRAAALDPSHQEYWIRSQALRTRAAMKAKPQPVPRAAESATEDGAAAEPVAEAEEPARFDTYLTEEDLDDLKRLKPPPLLKALEGQKTIDLNGDAKLLFEKTAEMFGLDVVFDREYQAGPPIRFYSEGADYRQALRILEDVTGSFVIPVADKLFMVAKDTAQKRTELEPTVAVSIPLPTTVTPQEVQELTMAVRQTMELMKVGVDANRQMVYIKDRISKVYPAQAILTQLLQHRATVELEVEFVEITSSSAISLGLLSPTEFPLVYLGRALHSVPQAVGTQFSRLLVFGGGKTLFGIGLADAQLVARLNKTTGRILLKAAVRSIDGSAASLHIGDKYPIQTGGLAVGRDPFGAVPSFNFEDLGLTLKITPRVHGLDEMSLDLEAEFKVLAGRSENGIPIIANRRLNSKVRLRNGQWGIVAGLMSATEARNISGIYGLSNVPLLGMLFRRTDRDVNSDEVVLLIKPHILSLPPSETFTPELYVGSESRLRIPI